MSRRHGYGEKPKVKGRENMSKREITRYENKVVLVAGQEVMYATEKKTGTVASVEATACNLALEKSGFVAVSFDDGQLWIEHDKLAAI